jgi:hypothetical protein
LKTDTTTFGGAIEFAFRAHPFLFSLTTTPISTHNTPDDATSIAHQYPVLTKEQSPTQTRENQKHYGCFDLDTVVSMTCEEVIMTLMVFGEQQHLGESLIKRHHVLLNAEGIGITMSERGGQDTQK